MTSEPDQPPNGLTKRGVPPWKVHQLCRELATGDKTRAQLAREYGITRPSMTQFAQRHADRIAEIRDHLDDQFAGLWIADKEQRLAAAERDYEQSASGDYAGHWEHVRTRSMIRREVAEELGQLPPKQTTVLMPVQHVVVNVNLEDLK